MVGFCVLVFGVPLYFLERMVLLDCDSPQNLQEPGVLVAVGRGFVRQIEYRFRNVSESGGVRWGNSGNRNKGRWLSAAFIFLSF